MPKYPGEFKFVRDHGADRAAGHIGLVLEITPGVVRPPIVEWAADKPAVPAAEREKVLTFLGNSVRAYGNQHSVGTVDAVVVTAGWDPIRHNELHRAAYVAFARALFAGGLPPLLGLYAAPNEDETCDQFVGPRRVR